MEILCGEITCWSLLGLKYLSISLPTSPRPLIWSVQDSAPLLCHTDSFSLSFVGGLSVCLAIFSGRRDPEWTVLSSNPKFEEIHKLLVDARTRGFTYRSERMPSRLGYKGFLVWDKDESKITSSELIVGPETVKLQQLLLETIPDDVLPQGKRKGVLEEINAGNIRAGVP